MKYNSKTSLEQKTTFEPDIGKAGEIKAAYDAANDTFKVLDIGCGHGHYHEDMKETLEGMGDKEVEIIGLDIRPESLRDGGVEGAAYDFSWGSIPFKDESLDMVYNSHLLCQLEDEVVDEVREEVERVLKDTGVKYHEHIPL